MNPLWIVMFFIFTGLGFLYGDLAFGQEIDPEPSRPIPIDEDGNVIEEEPEPEPEPQNNIEPEPELPEIIEIIPGNDFITPEDEDNCSVQRIERNYHNPFSMQILFETNINADLQVSATNPENSQARMNSDENTINFWTNSTDIWTMKFSLPYNNPEGKFTTFQYFTGNKIINTEKLPVHTSDFCRIFFVTTEPAPFTPTFEDFQKQFQTELSAIVGDQQQALVNLGDLITVLVYAFVGFAVISVILFVYLIFTKRDEKEVLDQSTKSLDETILRINKIMSGHSILISHQLGKFEQFVNKLELEILTMTKRFTDFMILVESPVAKDRTKLNKPIEPTENKNNEEPEHITESGGFIQGEQKEDEKPKEKSIIKKVVPESILDKIHHKQVINEENMTKEEYYMEFKKKEYTYDELMDLYKEVTEEPGLMTTPHLLRKQDALYSVISERVKEMGIGK